MSRRRLTPSPPMDHPPTVTSTHQSSIYVKLFRGYSFANEEQENTMNQEDHDVREDDMDESACEEDYDTRTILEQIEDDDYDEEQDEDYIPTSSSEASESDDSDAEDDLNLLVDETPTIASLLLRTRLSVRRSQRHSSTGNAVERPVTQSVSSTFDPDEDGMSWTTEEEKKQWIEEYEAKNCAFVERYGCRIDSFAQPEAKERLRRERQLVSKYALILFGLMVVYGTRLLWNSVGSEPILVANQHRDPFVWLNWIYRSSPSNSSGTTNSDPLKEVGNQTSTPEISEEKPPYTPVSLTDVDHDTTPVADQTSRNEIREIEFEGIEEHSMKVPKIASDTVNNDVKSKGLTNVKTGEVQHIISETNPSSNSEPFEDKTFGNTNVKKTAVSGVENEGTEENGEKVSVTIPTGLKSDQNVQKQGSVGTKHTDLLVETPTGSTKQVNQQKSTRRKQQTDLATPESSTKSPYQVCADMFNKLITSKNNHDMKTSTIEHCNEAVNTANPKEMEWIRTYVLRGDMWSILNEFGRADEDYNKATTKSALFAGKPFLQSRIQLKILANRWTQYVWNKQYKDLRRECQQILSSSALISKETKELANDWLRVFKKERQMIDVLTKSRSWTMSRLEIE